jgi:hypothetical protein
MWTAFFRITLDSVAREIFPHQPNCRCDKEIHRTAQERSVFCWKGVYGLAVKKAAGAGRAFWR